MALNLVGQFYMHPDLSYPSPYLDGRTVKVFWDDVTIAFRVFLYDSAGVQITEAFSGPNITGRRSQLQPQYIGYKYCDGTTLNELQLANKSSNAANPLFQFPYGKRTVTTNHWSCAVHVCDIEFDLTATAVTPDSGASDGTISVEAESSGGPVRFTRDPNATYDQALPSVANAYTFTGLVSGTYVIYAIDSFGCKTSITVNVSSTEIAYATRWRLQYKSLLGLSEQIDIEEKEYSGPIIIVKADGDPFQLTSGSMSEVNLFNCFSGSDASINLISETDQQFVDLFTQDERKFRVKYYSGASMELRWVGFVLPMLYSEPYYTDRNYPVTISATDQIGNLKDIVFTDDYGNVLSSQISVLDAICMILRKTDINLPVRESVNIYEARMQSGPEDSGIQQSFFDPTIYIDVKCDEVLNKLLISFGARLLQYDGYWNIELIEQKGYNYDYRLFNINGQYVSNGSINKVSVVKKATENNRSVLKDRSGLITIMPSYGEIEFLIKTFFDNNLLKRGTFEESDLANGQIIGWTADLTNGTGIRYGIEKFQEERSEKNKSALFVDFENTTSGAYIVLIAEEFDLAPINGTSLNFSIEALLRPYFKEIYSFIDIAIKIGDLYVTPGNNNIPAPAPANDALIDGEYQRFYIDEVLTWKKIEIAIKSTSRTQNQELSGPVSVKIRVSNNKAYDYNSISALRTQPTNNLTLNKHYNRAKVHDGTALRIYYLEFGTDAHNSPETIRPNDYNSTGFNTYVWKLQKTLREPDTDFLLAGILIDNVTLGVESVYPEEYSFTSVINENIKQKLEVKLYHSDLEISQDQEIEGLTENTARLSKAFLRLNNGLPTALWSRTYLNEARPLIDILLDMYKAQVTSPSLKLSGSFFTDLITSGGNSFYEAHLKKYFIANNHSTRSKLNSFDAELLELKTGPGGVPPNPEVFEFTDEHSTEFNA